MLDSTLLTSILTRTRTLVAQGWCQGDYAQYENGASTWRFNPKACKFCLHGALDVILDEQKKPWLFTKIHAFLLQCLPPGIPTIEHYNDLLTTTQADVLALLERAMAEVGK